MSIPQKPEGPPCRTFKSSFFGIMIETKESKLRTQEWRDRETKRKALLKTSCNSCTNKYDGTNGNGYQPCGCNKHNFK